MFARIIAGMASERSEEKTVMIDASKLKTCHAASGTASKGFRSTEPLDQLKRSLKAFVAGVIKRFSDAIHFESQLTHPTALAEAMVPCSTTTIYSECLDLLSAAADEGIEAAQNQFRDHDKLPYRLFAFAPGKKTAATVTEAVLNMEPVIGLGEFEHFTYSSGSEDDFRKATWVREKGGHQPDPCDQDGDAELRTVLPHGRQAWFTDAGALRRYRADRQPVEHQPTLRFQGGRPAVRRRFSRSTRQARGASLR